MTLELTKGQRTKIIDAIDTNKPFKVVANLQGLSVDYAIFGLDAQGKLSNDNNMVFYNQTASPCQGIKLLPSTSPGQGVSFEIDLTKLSSSIEKMAVVASVDATYADNFSKLTTGMVSIVSDNSVAVTFDRTNTAINFEITPQLFISEKAVILLEIYKKDAVWRLSATAQGFAGGLDKLVEYFGATVADSPSVATGQSVMSPQSMMGSTPMPSSNLPGNNVVAANTGLSAVASTSTPAQASVIDLKKKISLEKAQKTGDASIIDLTKKSLVSLEKKNLLSVKARVALVLDASGSMNWQYDNGDVQRIVNRVMPLAINFDDDGAFECWAFAEYPQQLPDVNLMNVKDFIKQTNGGYKRWSLGARINQEEYAIQQVIDFYNKFNDGIPVYVVFISDGGVGSRRKMQSILTHAAYLPIFWQFVGVGGRNYGVLENLDDMGGRIVDNCNFFSVDGITHISDEKLYELLLEEFPAWLKAARLQNIVK